MFTISIVNRSRFVKDDELLTTIRAINRQIREDFEPYWDFGGHLRLEGNSGKDLKDNEAPADMRGDAVIYICDDSQADDALGYHERNMVGIPYGFVDIKLCKKLDEAWSITLSHEALELIADPQANLLVKGPHPQGKRHEVYHWFEVCDAVQGPTQAYRIDGVLVSNFVLPHYFTPGEQAGGRNDFRGSRKLKSFSTLPGGYIGYFDPESQTDESKFGSYSFADVAAKARQAIKAGTGIGRSIMRRAATLAPDPIEHVVVLMLENRSFDHMLGALPGIGALDMSKPPVLRDAHGTPFRVNDTPLDALSGFGPHADFDHEHPAVMRQLNIDTATDTPRMDGFLQSNDDYASFPAARLMQALAVFPDGGLPVLHTLAKQFLVCNNWFSSLPGPTWPNRLFALSGTSNGDVTMPSGSVNTLSYLFRYGQDTIFDRLDDAGKEWRIYHHGIPNSIILRHQWGKLGKYRDFGNFAADIDAYKKTADFPAFTWIEPDFFGDDENDQHPPSPVSGGEQLIADVYNAIRRNDALWQKTLLVVYYDEHGGFYDHVAPGKTVAPDAGTEQGFAFDRLGVRVPALLISPWLSSGVDSTVFDHTSLLRYLCDKWHMPYLGKRMPVATSVAAALHWGDAPRDVPFTPLAAVAAPRTAAAKAAAQPATLDAGREALLGFMEALADHLGLADAVPAATSGIRAARAAGRVAGGGAKPVAKDPAARVQRARDAFLTLQRAAAPPRAAGKAGKKVRMVRSGDATGKLGPTGSKVAVPKAAPSKAGARRSGTGGKGSQ
jgi:phospholipase C